LKIIIVDDDKCVLDVLTRMIRRVRPAVKNAIFSLGRSDVAWNRISIMEEGPFIVFSSVDMDGQSEMSGLDLLTAVKQKFPDTIFVSMSGTHSYAEEAEQGGANYFLSKPFSRTDIEKIFAENA